MKSDFSRDTYKALRHFSRVWMQQGRVQLDADWNEQGDITAHRAETEALDVIGGCGAPIDNAGFGISTSLPFEFFVDLSPQTPVILSDQNSTAREGIIFDPNNIFHPPVPPDHLDFLIGAGRYYVDGILCENETLTSFTQQPDLPKAPALTSQGLYVVYLDVWQRLITWLDDPSIRETALGGPDTATRAKTICQVKAWRAGGAGTAADCSTQIGAFDSLIAPPTGKLTVREAPEVITTSPCDVPPGAGYRGLENQLYRIEVHHGGSGFDVGTNGNAVAVSRVAKSDNQVAYPSGGTPLIITQPDGTQVARYGNGGQWQAGQQVELVGLTSSGGNTFAGTLATITDVNTSRRILTLNIRVADIQADALGLRPVNATFLWSRDNGIVVSAIEGIDGNDVTVHDLGPDAVLGFAEGQLVEYRDDVYELNGNPGVLARIVRIDLATRTITLNTPLPPLQVISNIGPDLSHHPKLRRWEGGGAIKFASGGGWLDLESGLQIRFDTGTFRTGDYWTIPARTATADALSGNIEWARDGGGSPLAQLSFGIGHHYCRLAMVNWDGNGIQVVEDCREIFPSLTTPTMVYVGGDGQEVMPGNAIPQPLEVGVFNGRVPVRHANVQFAAQDGGRLAKSQDVLDSVFATTLNVNTGADGIARCDWRLRADGPLSQRVRATLAGVAGPVVDFSANFSLARAVAYEPGSCSDLFGATTVQQALDILCVRKEDCECTVCVSPAGNGGSAAAIQAAIEEAKAKGGGKVCLKPGCYVLEKPIVIDGACGLTLTGHDGAWLVFSGAGPAIAVQNSFAVTIEQLIILGFPTSPDVDSIGIDLHDCAFDTEVRDCVITLYDPIPTSYAVLQDGLTHGVGIRLSGVLHHSHLLRNAIAAGTGIGTNGAKLCGLNIEIRQNLLLCGNRGVDLDCLGLTANIDQNWIVTDTQLDALAIALSGTTAARGAVAIDGNSIVSAGGGISFTTSATTVSNNTLTGVVPSQTNATPVRANASFLPLAAITCGRTPLTPLAPNSVKIFGNRIAAFRGNGICFNGAVASAMVKQNSITDVGGCGIGALPGVIVTRLSVENNDIERVATLPAPFQQPPCAIRIVCGDDVDVSHNRIAEVAASTTNMGSRGISVFAPKHLRVIGNSISGIRSAQTVNINITLAKTERFIAGPAVSAGIEIAGGYGTVEIVNNDIQWRAQTGEGPSQAILIGDVARINSDTSGWAFVLNQATANTARVAGNTAPVTALSSSTIIVFDGNFFVLSSAEQALIIRSNALQMIGPGQSPLVTVNALGTCTFGGNDCRAVSQLPPEPLVSLNADTAIVDSNHLIGGHPALNVGAGRWTVLGNIYQGSINVNGAGLPVDWSKYNTAF